MDPDPELDLKLDPDPESAIKIYPDHQSAMKMNLDSDSATEFLKYQFKLDIFHFSPFFVVVILLQIIKLSRGNAFMIK